MFPQIESAYRRIEEAKEEIAILLSMTEVDLETYLKYRKDPSTLSQPISQWNQDAIEAELDVIKEAAATIKHYVDTTL